MQIESHKSVIRIILIENHQQTSSYSVVYDVHSLNVGFINCDHFEVGRVRLFDLYLCAVDYVNILDADLLYLSQEGHADNRSEVLIAIGDPIGPIETVISKPWLC